MIFEAILIPKINARLQEIASNFSKFSGGGPPDPPPALAPSALHSGIRPLTAPLSKIPRSAPGDDVFIARYDGEQVKVYDAEDSNFIGTSQSLALDYGRWVWQCLYLCSINNTVDRVELSGNNAVKCGLWIGIQKVCQ